MYVGQLRAKQPSAIYRSQMELQGRVDILVVEEGGKDTIRNKMADSKRATKRSL